MSFTDYTRPEPARHAAPNWVGLQNYIDVLHERAGDPQLQLRAAHRLQHLSGPSRTSRSTSCSAWRSRSCSTPTGLRFKRFYRALYILPGRHPAAHRGDGLDEHVRRRLRRGQPDPARRSAASCGMPGRRPSTPTGCARSRIRSRSSRCRWPSSRCSSTNTWLGWPLNAVVATGALQSIPQRAVRGGRDRRRRLVAEVQDRDARRTCGRRCCRTRSTAS